MTFLGPSPNAVVFISYKHDMQELVLKLKEELELNDLTCWMDVKNTEGGDVLAKEIDKGIRGCKVSI